MVSPRGASAFAGRGRVATARPEPERPPMTDAMMALRGTPSWQATMGSRRWRRAPTRPAPAARDARLCGRAVREREVGGLTGAAHGEKSPECPVRRNRYRDRDRQTRAGTVERHPEIAQGHLLPRLPGGAADGRALRQDQGEGRMAVSPDRCDLHDGAGRRPHRLCGGAIGPARRDGGSAQPPQRCRADDGRPEEGDAPMATAPITRTCGSSPRPT